MAREPFPLDIYKLHINKKYKKKGYKIVLFFLSLYFIFVTHSWCLFSWEDFKETWVYVGHVHIHKFVIEYIVSACTWTIHEFVLKLTCFYARVLWKFQGVCKALIFLFSLFSFRKLWWVVIEAYKIYTNEYFFSVWFITINHHKKYKYLWIMNKYLLMLYMCDPLGFSIKVYKVHHQANKPYAWSIYL